MPVPAFGFSAGDFVSAINLIRKISKALHRTGGAATEYQHAIIELKGLENVLRNLEKLEPNGGNERHINAVRGMALACQLPLRDFLTKVEKYEASLGPFSNPQWFRGLPQKSKWAVTFGEEVEKMRTLVAAKTMSISLLLTMNLSTSLSKMEANLANGQEKNHSELLIKAAEHRSNLGRIEERITSVEDGIQHASQSSDRKVEALSSEVEATKAAVMSFRDVGQQILSFISTFPLEMRDLLRKILQSNWRLYHLLLNVQQSVAHSPTQLLDSNIHFEDAMGELIELPYAYFRHWETFEGFLRSHHKGTIGEVKVSEGQFKIINVGNGSTTIKKDHWTRSIDQGSRISMSMVMSQLRRAIGKCPRSSCTGSRFATNQAQPNILTCELCNLKFYPQAGELEDVFGQITVQEEEDLVAQKQAEEDLRLYGTRIEPADAVDVDEEMQLSELPPKRSASEFHEGVDRPAKVRKKGESQAFNYESITAMDWNAGESPLMAWVNQSAVPSAVPPNKSLPSPPLSQEEDLLKQEEKEIEVFKNVSINDASVLPTTDNTLPTDLEGESDLDFGAKIYYRNIVDRYPLLPPYLTRRLAIANQSRAARLQQSRLKNEKKVDVNADAFRTRLSQMRVANESQGTTSKQGQAFWTGRRENRRPSSVQSYGSSRNSSLHGSEENDRTYQNTYLSNKPLEAISSPRSLLPAPIDWTAASSDDRANEDISFDCEICGATVVACRKRVWQKHALRDLRPYTCTLEDCSDPDETYASVYTFLSHEIESHKRSAAAWSPFKSDTVNGNSAKCLFCGLEATDRRDWKSRIKHVGQHMEEIAFMVVPQVYEAWEFYSEASSGEREDTWQNLPRLGEEGTLKRPYVCEEPGCEDYVGFTFLQDLCRHQEEVHNGPSEHRYGNVLRCRCYHKACDMNKGLPFGRWESLSAHLRSSHGELHQKPTSMIHICTNCGIVFDSLKDLSRHQRKISHKCLKCPRHFENNSELSTHQSCHPLSCRRLENYTSRPCTATFSRAKHRQDHEAIDHDNLTRKEFVCKLCEGEKAFWNRVSLISHMRVVHPTGVGRRRPRRLQRDVPEKTAEGLGNEDGS